MCPSGMVGNVQGAPTKGALRGRSDPTSPGPRPAGDPGKHTSPHSVVAIGRRIATTVWGKRAGAGPYTGPSSLPGVWRSLVAHSLWERGAVGSNPATPTSTLWERAG